MMLKSPPWGSSPVLPVLPGSDRLLNNGLSPNVLQQNPSLINTLVKGDGLHRERSRVIRVMLLS